MKLIGDVGVTGRQVVLKLVQLRGKTSMPAGLNSTEAKVRDCQSVREILDNYATQGVEFELLDEGQAGTLVLYRDESGWDWWPEPLALHRSQWPDGDRLPDDEAADDAWDELFETKGEEGLLALLRDLGPYLETPLLILLGRSERGDCTAQVWNVQPGKSEVLTLEASN